MPQLHRLVTIANHQNVRTDGLNFADSLTIIDSSFCELK